MYSTGVVDEDVNATEPGHSLVDGILQLRVITDVHHTRQTLATSCLNCVEEESMLF